MERLEQNIRKQIDCKRPSSTKQMNRVDYKLFVLKNMQVEIIKVRLALSVFVSFKLALNYIKQARLQLVSKYNIWFDFNNIWFQQVFNDKVVTARCLVQYWQIFLSFLIFCYYFTRLKARKIFPILHSAPCDNNYLS